jgi:type II secretory pathway component GspD/PulD (secretin)
VNPRPRCPPAPASPQEASLNFEALDVREVAKVILGDYLKQSYTVHPAVTGTVTFRTVGPIAMKDLLPTLEMLLRQNSAAVVREEGIYKILPIARCAARSRRSSGGARAAPAGLLGARGAAQVRRRARDGASCSSRSRRTTPCASTRRATS